MSLTSLFHERRTGLPARERRKASKPRYRPHVESMEDRFVLSGSGGAAAAMVAALPHAKPSPAVAVNVPLNITGINLQSITQNATTGVLTAVGTITGTLLNQNFVTNFTATLTPPTGSETCPVLDLQLAPIHLSLLGANVDTSAICLDVTATEGGGLLGDLLCGGLDNLLTGLTSGTLNLNGVLSGLNTLLNNSGVLGGVNQLLSQATSQFASPTVTATSGQMCNVLNLSLGPVNLSLLGLNVSLDNCASGPVTVSITATQGGGILGDLLCGLSGVLSTQKPSVTAIDSLLNQIVTLVQTL